MECEFRVSCFDCRDEWHLWNLSVHGFDKSVEENSKCVGTVHLVNLYLTRCKGF